MQKEARLHHGFSLPRTPVLTPLSTSQVPEEERERTEKGWTNLLFDRLKTMLGGRVLL